MSPKFFWLLFLICIGLSILAYTGHTAYVLWQYMRLNQTTTPLKVEWSVNHLSDEAFAPQAIYQYKVKDQLYQGRTIWQDHYLNAWAAQEAVDRLSHSPTLVWYDNATPELSSMQANFPYKACFSTIFLWMLGLYFFGLNEYVKRRFS